MEVLALIPARSGSKSVKDKNIRDINGKPMIAYSIEHGLRSEYVNRVIVSTDSEKYAEIARKYGAEVPFLRPEEFARDNSLDIEVFEHALKWLKEKENYVPDIVVQLRPTYPVRNVKDIDKMVEMMMEDMTIDSVRCIVPAKEIPYKMWLKGENGQIHPLMKDIKECYNMPRQELPKAYYQNACIDIIRADVITEQHSMSGKRIVGYEMEENFDIDTEEEFARTAEYLRISSGGRKFVFDIDGVIAKIQKDLDYSLSEPDEKMVEIINKLYDMGNYIVLFTARGYVTGKDWSDVTKQQMERWGVKYHELKFGKPNADFYVDDKMISLERLRELFS